MNMKRKVRILTLFLMFSMLFGMFCSCVDKKEQAKEDVVLTAADLAQYVLLRSDNASDAVRSEFVRLRTALIEKLGVELKPMTDWIHESNPESEKEIIVGSTNRTQSQEAQDGLRCNDFRIVKIDEKIIIACGSDEVMPYAIDYFLESIVEAEQKTLLIPGEGHDDLAAYRFDSISIDGVDITEFELFATDKEVAQKIGNALKFDVVGYDLKQAIAYDPTDTSKHYIRVDASNLMENEYGITVEDGDIVIHGSYNTIDKAIDYFLDIFLAKNGSTELKVTEAETVALSTEKKSIYTKEQLMAVLEMVNNDPNHVIIGEEGQSGLPPISSTMKLFTEATSGHVPGIIGTDLWMMTKDSEELSQWVSEIVDYCSNGGIFASSCHFTNPSGNTKVIRNGKEYEHPYAGCLGYDHTKEGYAKAFADLVTDGTELNLKFREQLDEMAVFYGALKDQGVPILFRPFLELNSSSFWWCIQQMNDSTVVIDPSCIQNMWRYLYDYFTNVKGLDNLIWVYSVVNWNGGYAVDCYPGDEYVDISGVDWYVEPAPKDGLYTYSSIDSISPNKIHALCEFGPGGDNLAKEAAQAGTRYNGVDMLRDLKKVVQTDGCKLAYVLNWSCPWNLDRMGGGKYLMDDEFTLGQAEVAALFASLSQS